MGQEGDSVLYSAGNARRLYTYVNSQWTYLGFTDVGGKIIVDGEIEIGSYLKADDTYGLWMGHATWASSPFRVNLAGDLWATSATISGNITATSGTIGGFTINASSLTAGTGATAVGLAPGTYPIYAGSTTAASAPFRVSSGGVVTCSNIIATGGTIGGFTISATALSDEADTDDADILLDKTNSLIRLGDTASTNIILDGDGHQIRTSDYVSGALGSGWGITGNLAEFNNIRARGKFTTAVFEKEAISSVGGNLLVSDSDILDADMTALDASTLTISGDTTFAVGDFLRIKDGVYDEWLEVTNIASAPTYTVIRDKAGVYGADDNPIWKKGTAVINYGVSGEGLLYMTASESNAPYLSVLTHAGTPWTTTTTRVRLGNLNGYLGYATDLYGIAIGETDAYLKYDPTNGLRIKGSITITGGTAQTFVQSAIPTSLAIGDTWQDTDDNKLYVAQSVGADEIVAGEWVEIASGDDGWKDWQHASDTTKIDGGDIYTNTVTATQINVSQLSAIAADMGSITAGTVTGATLQTAASGARVLLNTSNLIAYDDAAAEVFKVLISGADVGDVILGSATKYVKWDKSAGNLLVADLQSPNYASGTTGYKLSASSGLEVNTGTIKGSVIDGTFTTLFSTGIARTAEALGQYFGASGLPDTNWGTMNEFYVQIPSYTTSVVLKAQVNVFSLTPTVEIRFKVAATTSSSTSRTTTGWFSDLTINGPTTGNAVLITIEGKRTASGGAKLTSLSLIAYY